MIPLGSKFAYFCAAVPLTEEDQREYLEEPIAALPPSLAAELPKISILLVPYLSKAKPGDIVSTERPPEGKLSWTTQLRQGQEAVFAFTFHGHDVAEYHYRFYQHIARLVADHHSADISGRFQALLQDEFAAQVHGEVDEDSWRLKQSLWRRRGKVKFDSKAFREYARQAFIDTLTLYLHGICCDIDVDTGPRQLQSRRLKQRLLLLRELYPPKEGYAVFPEDLK